MDELSDTPTTPPERAPKVGRPRRGTEAARADSLLSAATRVFLRDGYNAASIDRVAAEGGASTRTIYERYKNKADLLNAVITRLVDRDLASGLAPADLDRLEPSDALMTIGRILVDRICDPESAALFRILAKEADRCPDLAAQVRSSAKARINDAIAHYLHGQVRRGNLLLADPDRAAVLFLQMVCAEIHECLLFGPSAELAAVDFSAHLTTAVDLFLNGALPRTP